MDQALFERKVKTTLTHVGTLKYGSTRKYAFRVDDKRWTLDIGVRPDWSRKAYVYALAYCSLGKQTFKMTIPLNITFTYNKTFVFPNAPVND